MKKSALLILVLLLLLTACQGAPVSTEDPTVSTPLTSAAPTAPTTQPTTAPTIPPTVPTTQPTEPPYDICNGQLWPLGRRLFWRVKATAENLYVADDVWRAVNTDTHIFYIVESERTKIYVVTIGNFTDHRVYYESDYGNIIDFNHVEYRDSKIRNYLQFVAGEKRFVMLDMTTGETSVILEAYLIRNAHTYDPNAEWITFEGKLTEDSEGGLFDYNRITGELIEDTDCDCEECV